MDFEKQLREEFQSEAKHMQPSDELEKRVSNSFEKYRQTKVPYKSLIKKRVLIGATSAACIGAITIFSTAMPSYANMSPLTPIFKPVLDYFHIKEGAEKITEESATVKKSNGVKVTINSTVYDGVTLIVSYTVEGSKAFEKEPKIETDKSYIVVSNEKNFVEQKQEYGEFKDKDHKVYSGAVTFAFNNSSFNPELQAKENGNRIKVSDIANNFNLSLNIDRLGGREGELHGKWDFDLPVQSVPAKQSEKEIIVNKDLSELRSDAKLEKVVVTPLRIYLQGSATAGGGAFDYLVLDDKGEVLKQTENQVNVDVSKNSSISTAAFETISRDTKSITVIPYVYGKKHSGYDTKNKIQVNKVGETKVPLGGNEEMTITRIEEKAGETYVYYKTTKPISNLWPFFIVDEEGKEEFGNKEKRISTVKGEESVEIFRTTFGDKKLFIVNPNTVYYDQAFTVEFK
ncbi:DUF4179 domain-containing protein [Bacillus mobilis]|uniref:DUF4179 domain-containing protein n=1 Tax=Bacillus mobilis TaxID=2026190 RepID=UPI001E45C5EB|nr:DUF4179 domain-containing protein [Bacillus mobilis]MCC2461483.1 DUF4179 domain-containing protein [Bacillus mobilis]MCU5434293.1 DUF4179 domain-containing protein [Bacillus mobilis]